MTSSESCQNGCRAPGCGGAIGTWLLGWAAGGMHCCPLGNAPHCRARALCTSAQRNCWETRQLMDSWKQDGKEQEAWGAEEQAELKQECSK